MELSLFMGSQGFWFFGHPYPLVYIPSIVYCFNVWNHQTYLIAEFCPDGGCTDKISDISISIYHHMRKSFPSKSENDGSLLLMWIMKITSHKTLQEGKEEEKTGNHAQYRGGQSWRWTRRETEEKKAEK